MTLDQFNTTPWKPGMMAEYRGERYPVISVDFEEFLIGIEEQVKGSEYRVKWIRCENADVVNFANA